MRLLSLILLLVFVLNAPAQAQDTARTPVFGAESFTLPNGMKVVAVPNHRVPAVTHMVWYRVGAADEPPGLSGIAHFAEHMMFKGTETLPPGEFSKRVKLLGGNDNAFTGQDITAYFQSVASEHLETIMRMEADRMVNLSFPDEELASERLVVLEERRQRTENDPRGYFVEQMRTALFPNHPYGNPVVGWLHEVETLTGEDVMGFYNRWYAPNNAILVVSGDITMDTLRPLAEEIYGRIPARAVPERNWSAVPPLPANPRLYYEHETIKQPRFSRFYRAPSSTTDKDTALALDILASIMGDGPTSRFYKSLVYEQKLATTASFRYSGAALSEGEIRLGANPAVGVSMKTVEAAIDEELRVLIRDGVTAQEVADAKTRLTEAAIFARDSLSGPAMIFGYSLATGSTIEDIEYWPYDIEAVTIEQINAAARRYLDPDNNERRPHVTGYLLPKAQESEESSQ